MAPAPDEPTGPDLTVTMVRAVEGDTGNGAYRGRRRATAGRRARLATVAASVAAVGLVLVGSSLVVRSLTAPVAAPVVPPSATPALSPSPSPVPLPPPIDEPSPVAGLGTAPAPSPPPTPDPPPPSPPPSEEPAPPPDQPSQDPDEPLSLAFEAEAADRAGDTNVVPEQRASGGEVVDLNGSGSWCLVRFPGVAVDRDGWYELTIHYLSRWEDTVAWVSVDDSRPDAVGFQETSGDSVGARTVRVRLDGGGDNVIVISTASCDDAPRLDLITVTD